MLLLVHDHISLIHVDFTSRPTPPINYSYESLDYKEHFIVTADLDTLLPAASASSTSKLTPADVQVAVTEALLAEEDGVADSQDPLDVCICIIRTFGLMMDLLVTNCLGNAHTQKPKPKQALQVTVHDAQADPILKAHFPEYYPDKHGASLLVVVRRLVHADSTNALHAYTYTCTHMYIRSGAG